MTTKPADPRITAAIAELGNYVTGLRVLYRSFGMSLYPPEAPADADKDDRGYHPRDFQWCAIANPDAIDEETGDLLEVECYADTPMAAMEAAFVECEEAEDV